MKEVFNTRWSIQLFTGLYVVHGVAKSRTRSMSVSCQPSPRPLISPTQSLLTPTLLPKPLLKVPHLGSLNCPVSGDPIPQDFAQVTLFQTMFSVCLFGCAGLCCCTRAFSSCRARVSLWGSSCCQAWAPGHTGSVVVAHRLSCPMAGGIFPDHRSNPCTLHCKADS